MKVIIKTVEIPIYVSDDGKEFKCKETCLYHEKREKALRKYRWEHKVFEDLINFFDSCDCKGYNAIILCDKTMLINDLLFYQDEKERRTSIINIKTGRVGRAICNNEDCFSRIRGVGNCLDKI